MSVTVPSRTSPASSAVTQSTSSIQNNHQHPVTQKNDEADDNHKSENPSPKSYQEEITTLSYTTIAPKKLSGKSIKVLISDAFLLSDE